MSFTQSIGFTTSDVSGVRDLMAAWDAEQAAAAPGYLRSRLLADRDHAGRYLVVVDFSSEEEAQRNNERPETQQWAERVRSLIDGEPEYHNLRVVYETQTPR